MTFQTLKRKFVQDLKTSWKKTATLGVLLAVGFSMWIPQLIQSIGGSKQAKTGTNQTAKRPKQPGSTQPTQSKPDANPVGARHQQLTWQEADVILRTNPLVRSAEVATMPGNPFRVDRDQFPPPILFTQPEKSQKTETQSTAAKTAVRSFEHLVLKSTMIGPRRRAAFINSDFYLEGSRLEFDGEVYRVQSVHPRKVTLRQGDRTWDIEIATSEVSPRIRVERPSPPNEPSQKQ